MGLRRSRPVRAGVALVIRLGHEERMSGIETLPVLGEAGLRYGTFGGGFSFIFRPHRSGCLLTD